MKFNSSLLKDKEYVRKIKEPIKETKSKYAKNEDSLGIVHDDNTEFQTDDQLLFEVMLMEIRSVTILYATFKKTKTKNEQNKEESLIKDVGEELEKNYTRENEGLKTNEKELQDLRKKKMEGMLI